jgi:hypothetical protein
MPRRLWHKPDLMDAQEVRDFFAEVERCGDRDALRPCAHGHFDCSVIKGGPCANEVDGRAVFLGIEER